MDWKDLGATLGKFAPLIGTAIGAMPSETASIAYTGELLPVDVYKNLKEIL